MATRKIVLYLFLFALGEFLFAEGTSDEVINVSGKVVDQQTNQPLPFAHIFIRDVGTVSNVDGVFNIAVDESFLNHEIKASFIGYKSSTLTLREGKDLSNLILVLAPVAMELEGVEVRSGEKILRNILNRLDFNYEYAHQNALCFFREQLSTQLSEKYVAEGIVDIYLPNNHSDNDIQVSVVKSRKESYDDDLSDDFVMIKGHAMDMIQSIVWRDDSFLNPKHRKHYDFTYDGVTMYNDREVLIVKFWPSSRRGRFKGKMFVDINSYAIIKVEYFPDTSRSSFWEQVRWTEEFNYRNGRWFLSRVSYEGQWYENDQLYDFESLLVVNIVETVEDTPAMGLLMSKNDTFYEEADHAPHAEDFWKGFSYVKSAKDAIY